MARIPPLEHAAKVEPIESYPVLMSRLGVDITQLPKRRRMGPALDQIERSAPGHVDPLIRRPPGRPGPAVAPAAGPGFCLTFRAADR